MKRHFTSAQTERINVLLYLIRWINLTKFDFCKVWWTAKKKVQTKKTSRSRKWALYLVCQSVWFALCSMGYENGWYLLWAQYTYIFYAPPSFHFIYWFVWDWRGTKRMWCDDVLCLIRHSIEHRCYFKYLSNSDSKSSTSITVQVHCPSSVIWFGFLETCVQKYCCVSIMCREN